MKSKMKRKKIFNSIVWLLLSFSGYVMYKKGETGYYEGFNIPPICGIIFIIVGLILFILEIRRKKESYNDSDGSFWGDIL